MTTRDITMTIGDITMTNGDLSMTTLYITMTTRDMVRAQRRTMHACSSRGEPVDPPYTWISWLTLFLAMWGEPVDPP